MWFDGQRQPNTLYVANTSRGKDSTAMLRAIQLMGWPLDMICSVDIWFDEDTPAELPQMVKFKDEYDAKILEWFGIPVTRLCATKRERQKQTESVTHSGSHTAECSTTGCHQEADLKERSEDSRCAEKAGARNLRQTKLTYCDIFYRQLKPREREREKARHNQRIPDCRWNMVQQRSQTERITGFPYTGVAGRGMGWCTGELKKTVLRDSRFRSIAETGVHDSSKYRIKGFPLSHQRGGLWCQDRLKDFSGKAAQTVRTSPLAAPVNDGRKINIVHYIGIASDEPKRIAKHIDKPDKVLPLVQICWDEALCGLEAQYMDMLSPTYLDGQLRDGCWFCHNQGINQLRRLRKNYPELWAKLMKLDLDSPVTFHPDGHTVHDFDRRFQLEDEGLIDPSKRFWWKMLDDDLQYMMNL